MSLFSTNRRLLKLTGFWIYDQPNTWKHLQYSYNIFCAFYVYFFYIPAEILYVFYSYHSLDEFLRALRDIGNHIALYYKAVNFFFRRKHLLAMMDILQDDFGYESFGNFHPEAMMKAAEKEARKWTRYFLYFVNAICLSMFLSGCSIFFFAGMSQYEMVDGAMVYAQKQPVNAVSPFGEGTRRNFFLTFVWTVVALTFCAWMIVALDSLFITLMSGINAHLNIVSGAFKTLRPRCEKRVGIDSREFLHDPVHLQAEMHKEMNKCVRHLQTIYSVSNELEDIYNGQTLFQTFISLGEMCFSLFLVSQIEIENIGNEVTYLFATAFELLMYCWFGNKITEASLLVPKEIFQSDWLSTSITYRKQMTFTMIRMQKPIYITIGKITPLTFSTFLTMARGAYSLFTFLKQRNRQ